MSKKKGTTVPLDQFLKPDTKITSWAEEDDFDADRRPSAVTWLEPFSHHGVAAGKAIVTRTFVPIANLSLVLQFQQRPYLQGLMFDQQRQQSLPQGHTTTCLIALHTRCTLAMCHMNCSKGM